MIDYLLETTICIVAASLLMIYHELMKVAAYCICKRPGIGAGKKHCYWKVWRYIDPVGLILAVISYAPISKPYYFRIREKKNNRILGIVGFVSLLVAVAASVLVLRQVYGGLDGINQLTITHWSQKIFPIFWQYMALLSMGMLLANLFPVSTFDMGLLIAGYSSGAYLGLIKSDRVVKSLFLLVLLVDMIHYGAVMILTLFL